MANRDEDGVEGDDVDDEAGIGFLDLALPLVQNAGRLIVVPLLAAAVGLGVSYLIPPTFTATTTFLPPQPPQSAAASALASLGSLAGVPAVSTLRTPGDQYIALMQSRSVADRLIDEFDLMKVYEKKYRFEARNALADRVHISLGKKDGLITVAVDDHSPQRAASLANRHVEELRRVTGALTLTEAQQRRAFFERQLQDTKGRLTEAQQLLEGSGFSSGALRAEPRAAADAYARLKAEVTAAEVRLQTLRNTLVDTAPEVQQQLATLGALRSQLARLEQTSDRPSDANYIGKYREFKYQESLFEIFSKQYELARLDEAREGAIIQVVDVADPPEHKSKPARALFAVVAGAIAALLLIVWIFAQYGWARYTSNPLNAEKWAALRASRRRRAD